MKTIAAFLLIIFTAGVTLAQSLSSSVEIVTVNSQNGKYFLRSTPYDDEFPTLPGTTQVFATGSSSPLYTIARGFDYVIGHGNNLVLSNDGNTVFYLITSGADEEKDEMKTISIYRRGELIQSYSASEITGCDLNKERCSIEYDNFAEVVDKELSRLGHAEV